LFSQEFTRIYKADARQHGAVSKQHSNTVTIKTGCSVCLDTHAWELKWRTKNKPLGIRKWKIISIPSVIHKLSKIPIYLQIYYFFTVPHCQPRSVSQTMPAACCITLSVDMKYTETSLTVPS